MRIEQVKVAAFEIPTASPEADGTLEWTRTVLVVVEVSAAGVTGLGYTYADAATATLIEKTLAKQVLNQSPMAIPALFDRMRREVRNLGRQGVAAMAISAMDCALWDLKARLLNVSLLTLLGPVREGVGVYGSGGFTSYAPESLARQLRGWVDEGIAHVKMKVGAVPSEDVARVRHAREAIGAGAELFVDANGAYSAKQALWFAERFDALGVTWFEEPVSSDDLEGLRLLRERGPAGMDIAAGEYGYDAPYFEHMLRAGAVDVLQADATRCGGVTGFLRAHAIADAFNMPMSTHCAPQVHVHLGCACARVRHLEYFYDHVRIEELLFEGTVSPRAGSLSPEQDSIGFGLSLRGGEAKRFEIATAVVKGM